MTRSLTAIAAFLLLVVPSCAWATRLEASPDAPFLLHLGAAMLLWSHIGGGAVGLLSGTVTVIARKGSRLHRLSGRVFLLSMFVAYFVAACVAPFLEDGQRPNFVAAILALYLLVSGILAARRKIFRAGRAEVVGLLVAITVTALGGVFMYMGVHSPTGTVDGSPPQAFVLFMSVGVMAGVGEVSALLRRTLSRQARIIRHLWRMCVSFFIASGSLFLGQPQVFPDSFNQSFAPVALAFAPLLVGLFWVIRVKFLGLDTRPAFPAGTVD